MASYGLSMRPKLSYYIQLRVAILQQAISLKNLQDKKYYRIAGLFIKAILIQYGSAAEAKALSK